MPDIKLDKQMTETQKELVKDQIGYLGAVREERAKVEDVWQDIADYVLPRVTEIKGGREPKPRRYGEKMYNSEPVSALRLASDGTSGYMMPRTSQWVQMQPMDKDVYKLPGVRRFYQESTEALHSELNRSNFYGVMTPVLDHGFSLGTSVVYVENDEESGSCQLIALDPAEMYIAENRYRKVDTFYRSHWVTGKHLMERYSASIDDELEQQIKRNPWKRYEVLHCVFKRNDRIHGRIDAANKPIASIHILVERNRLLRESGFDYPHFVAWRHRSIANTPYGGSPAWDALVAILRLNAHSMDLLDASHLAVRPPIAFPAEMSDYDISPNGANPYKVPGRVPQRIDVLGDFPVGLDREQAIEKAIRDHFQTDFFLLLTQSDRQKTAFEVSEMAGERAAVMSTVIGRIESELIDPLLEIIYRVAAENGRMPEPPPALLEAGAGQFTWEYVGPLSQLQKRHHGQQTRTQILGQAAPIFELFPDSRDVIDGDQLLREHLQQGGMNADVVREEDMVAKIRQARAEQEMQAQQAQQQIEAAKVMGGPKAPEPGSPADMMIEEGANARATPRDL